MTTQRMLIDASHPEETRVVIASGNRLDDFDVESQSRLQLKGNIYLAKVTRVEPSLQACFVDYGGNRHGFLAFSEIHPDYYQIPIADREALIAEHQAQTAAENADDEVEGDGETVETVGGGDPEEETEVRRPVNLKRHYKIQEVIKRRQILLVQVVKEERGNKGAALTTYLSLAGRYCVLMPNTARGGGISRKISSGTDRKRLKKIVGELDIPHGMAVIVRTAGSKRTKAEINRDYTYLMRLWSQVRDTTMNSIAPCLVHAEGDIVKRAIRDLYSKDVEEVIVSGAEAYRRAKDFMKLLTPSHAKKVQPYEDGAIPLMQKYQIEHQMDAMHSPIVQLNSGGYIVINPTEALVSIDVNSGRATRERNIEETALKTNLEAADEIARQLRLRDLSGLIVIDFIDMEVNRNQTKIERAVKDAMRNDRARIQVGRISAFGLLELSRQRLRPSLLETTAQPCPHCGGSGVLRSTDSTALQMLRVLEDEGAKKRSQALTLYVPTVVALYIFNNKRSALSGLEQRHELTVSIANDDGLIPPDYRLERIDDDGRAEVIEQGDPDIKLDEDGGKRRKRRRSRRRSRGDDGQDESLDEQEVQDNGVEASGDDTDEIRPTSGPDGGDDDGENRPRRRRRGRRGGRRRRDRDQDNGERSVAAGDENTPGDTEAFTAAADVEAAADAVAGETDGKPENPRGTRRGRKKTVRDADASETLVETAEATENPAVPADAPVGTVTEEAPKPKRERRAAKAKAGAGAGTAEASAETQPAPEPAPEPQPPLEAAAAQTTVIDVDKADGKPKRKGWWSKLMD